MKIQPTIKNQHGKYLYKEVHVSAILNAVHSDKDSVIVDGQTVHIKESIKSEDDWTVIVEVGE